MKVLSLGCCSHLRRFLEQNHVLVIGNRGEDMPGKPEELRLWIEDDGIEAVFFNLDAVPWSQEAAIHLRMHKVQIPLIGFKTRQGSYEQWIRALEEFVGNGADALFESVVPLHKHHRRSMLAHVFAIERRRYGILQNTLEFRGGEAVVTVNIASYDVAVNGIPVELHSAERRLVRFLAIRRGVILSPAEIKTNQYRSPDEEPLGDILSVRLSLIGKKLERIHPDARRVLKVSRGNGVLMDSCFFKETRAA